MTNSRPSSSHSTPLKVKPPTPSSSPTLEFTTSHFQTRFIIVSGGTVSGLGKGTCISSLGVVLKSHGYSVTLIKIDPYLNIDAGTMSPFEHGEVYVLEDGGEADLDLGNYERCLDLTLSSKHNITSGKIYDQVLKRERRGDYLGKTVQMVPHVTNAIQDWILSVSSIPVDSNTGKPHICLIELGGTVGDIESAPYQEALVNLQSMVGHTHLANIHVSYVPIIGSEQKSKPSQQSVRLLRESGIKPDFLFCRCKSVLEESTRKKLAQFCHLPSEASIFSLHDVDNLFRVPLILEEQSCGKMILSRLNLNENYHNSSNLPSLDLSPNSRPIKCPVNLNDWKIISDRVDLVSTPVNIGLVGKYNGLSDSYLSVIKSLQYASLEAGLKLNLVWIDSSDLEQNSLKLSPEKYSKAWDLLKSVGGILCPGGFGDRGIEGKIAAATYSRENNIPYFGICLGLQTAVISIARDMLEGMEDANSTEFNPTTTNPVVIFMPEINTSEMGGTMRLGNRSTIIKNENSLAFKLYGNRNIIYERHRHRYEVNPNFVSALECVGLIFSGIDEKGQRMEIAELKSHPYFIACQFHPEFKSRPIYPSPLFLGFILASASDDGISLLLSRFDMDGGMLRVGAGWTRKINENEETMNLSY